MSLIYEGMSKRHRVFLIDAYQLGIFVRVIEALPISREAPPIHPELIALSDVTSR